MARRRTTRKKRNARGKGSLRFRKTLLGVLLFCGAVLGYSGYQYYHHPERFEWSEAIEFGREVAESASGRISIPDLTTSTSERIGDEYIATVTRVVDGDTLVVTVGREEERIRLLCVDTAESVHPDASRNSDFGREASDYTKERLQDRQVRVRLEKGNEQDRFGRQLAYVILEGEVFNVELVRMGYSKYYTKYGKSKIYNSDFAAAEREAKARNLGFWSKDLDELALSK